MVEKRLQSTLCVRRLLQASIMHTAPQYHIDKLHHRCSCVVPLHASYCLRNPMNRDSYQHNIQLIQWGMTVLSRIPSVSIKWSLRNHLVHVLSLGCTLESYGIFKYWYPGPTLRHSDFNWSGKGPRMSILNNCHVILMSSKGWELLISVHVVDLVQTGKLKHSEEHEDMCLRSHNWLFTELWLEPQCSDYPCSAPSLWIIDCSYPRKGCKISRIY